MNDFLGTTDGIEEARYSAKKQNPFAVLALFILVYIIIASFISSFIVYLPLSIHIFSSVNTDSFIGITDSNEYMNAVQNAVNDAIAAVPYWIISVSTLFATAGSILTCMIYCKKFEKRSFSTMGFIKKGFFKEYIIGLVIGTFLFTAAVGIMLISGNISLKFSLVKNDIPIIILYFAGFIIQGMSEEVACRGYLMVSLAHNSNITAGVGISSLVFALLHLGNSGITLLAFINLFLFGVFASVYYLRRGSIWGIAAIHTAWNFVQGNIFGISVSGGEKSESLLEAICGTNSLFTGGSFGAEGGLPVTIVLICGITVLGLMRPKKISIH